MVFELRRQCCYEFVNVWGGTKNIEPWVVNRLENGRVRSCKDAAGRADIFLDPLLRFLDGNIKAASEQQLFIAAFYSSFLQQLFSHMVASHMVVLSINSD